MKNNTRNYLRLSVVAVALSAHFANAADDAQKDEEHVENLVITASPIDRTILQSSTPVSILAGEELRKNQQPTLGETLKNTPGVNGSYFGPVASSPIIRGLDGPRIKIVQNGLDTSDVSRVGADHIVTTESSTARQIEVLRGPATLLYGSGAIGGVVNVVDNRLPREQKEGIEGEVGYLHNTVSSEDTFNLALDGGSGEFAWHLDAFDRETDDYEIPGFAEVESEEEDHEEEEEAEEGILENSFIDANGFTVGAGYVTEDFVASFSYGQLNSEYGIPGSHHHHEDEHEDEEEHEEGEEHSEEEEEGVFGDLEQDRVQAMIDWKNLDGFLSEVHWHNGYTDYTHSEIEDGARGTTFDSETLESRLWAKHQEIGGWSGALGLHFTNNEFSADGEEAFTAPNESDTLAIFIAEEKQVGNIIWQLGARVERVEMTVDNSFYEEEEHEDEHEGEEEHEEIFFDDLDFTAVSLSAGAVWQLDDQSSFAINIARSERAPSAAEIFANGNHIATGTFEVGLGFELEVEGEEFETLQADGDPEKEVSNNLDLTYRYNSEDFSASVSLFYNQISDFIFEQNTGLFFEEGGHGHDEEEEHEEEHEEGEEHADEDEHGHEEEEGTPVLIFQQQDADMYGFEVELDWHINEQFRFDAFADYIRAELDEGGNVPRIPPMRIGAELHWEYGDWHADLGATYHAKQDDIAENETETDSYTLVSASINYYTSIGESDVTIFLRGDNLTDEEARVHSSFIKDEAPLPGRGFSLGVRANF